MKSLIKHYSNPSSTIIYVPLVARSYLFLITVESDGKYILHLNALSVSGYDLETFISIAAVAKLNCHHVGNKTACCL